MYVSTTINKPYSSIYQNTFIRNFVNSVNFKVNLLIAINMEQIKIKIKIDMGNRN